MLGESTSISCSEKNFSSEVRGMMGKNMQEKIKRINFPGRKNHYVASQWNREKFEYSKIKRKRTTIVEKWIGK